MNRGIHIILGLLLVLIISCTKEPVTQTHSEQGVPVELRFDAFNTTATATTEEAVNRVRILIFSSVSAQSYSQLLYNKLAYPDASGLIAPVITTTGIRDIYLIVNEPLGASNAVLDKYTKIATVADIEALRLDYIKGSTLEYLPTEIPMFIRQLKQKIVANNQNVTNSKVERMMAKVTLNLNVKNSNFNSGKQPIIETITIKNLPSYSYYVAKPYTDVLTTSETQTATATTTVADYNYSSSNTFYVPEYILKDLSKGAYLEIKGHVNGNTTKDIKWIVKVGDAMDDLKQHGTRYDITRNRHYTFTGEVKSYGEHDVDILVNVSPWNNVPLTDENGKYISYLQKSTLPATNAEIANHTCFYTVVCATNVGGWSVVVKDNKGNIVGGSVSGERGLSNFAFKAPDITDGKRQEQTLNVTIQPNYEGEKRTLTLEIKHDLPDNKNFNEKRTYTQKYMQLVLVSDRKTDYAVNPVKPPLIKDTQLSGILGGWDGTSFYYLLYKYGSVVGIRSYFEVYPNQKEALYKTEDIAWEPVNKTYSPIVRWVMSKADNAEYSPGDIPWQTGTYTHTRESVKQGLGDPCRLVGLTATQIRDGEIDNYKWKTPDDSVIPAVIGDFNIDTQKAGLGFAGGLFLQGSGSRYYLTGTNSNQATAGFYRLTSISSLDSKLSNNFDVHAMYITTGNHALIKDHERGDGFSIRCIRQ